MYIHKCGRQFLLHPTPALPHSSSTTIVCSCILISIVAHCAMLLPLLLLPATCAFAAGNCSRGASKQQQTARQRESETDAGVDVAARYCCVIFFLVVGVTKFYIYTRTDTHTHRHSRTLTQGHTHTYLYSTHWKCAHHVVIAHEILFIYVYILLLLFLFYFALTFCYCCSYCCQCQFRCSPRCGVVGSVAVVVFSTHFALSPLPTVRVFVRRVLLLSSFSLWCLALLVGGTCKPFRLYVFLFVFVVVLLLLRCID